VRQLSYALRHEADYDGGLAGQTDKRPMRRPRELMPHFLLLLSEGWHLLARRTIVLCALPRQADATWLAVGGQTDKRYCLYPQKLMPRGQHLLALTMNNCRRESPEGRCPPTVAIALVGENGCWPGRTIVLLARYNRLMPRDTAVVGQTFQTPCTCPRKQCPRHSTTSLSSEAFGAQPDEQLFYALVPTS
jgi:hypothetical protein